MAKLATKVIQTVMTVPGFLAKVLRCCTLAGALHAALALPAQQTLSSYRLYTMRDGLPSNAVYKLLEDSYGYLWIGTAHGLSRFNGTNFRNFTSDNSGFPIRPATQLLQANDSLLLAGTASGLVVFNLTKNVFENGRLTDSLLRPGAGYFIHSMLRLPGGRVLVSVDDYVMLLNARLQVLHKRKVAQTPAQRYHFGSGIFLDRDSTIVLAAPDMKPLSTRTLQLLPPNFSEPAFSSNGTPRMTTAMAPAGNGGWFVSFWGAGISYYHPASHKTTETVIHKAGGEYNSIGHHYPDPVEKGSFWMSSGRGLWKLMLPDLMPEQFLFEQRGAYNPELNYCLQAMRDKSGNMWVATKAGLVKISRNSAAFQPVSQHGYQQSGKYPESEFTFAAADDKGRLWLGTYGSHLFQADSNGGFQRRFGKANSPIGELIHNVKVYNGKAYVASYFTGLYAFNEALQQFTPPAFLPKRYHGRSCNILYFDKQNRCWASFDGELICIDLTTNTCRVVQKNGDGSGIPRTPFHTSEADNGDMWFALGGWDGRLFRWQSATGRFVETLITLPGINSQKHYIHALFTDREGNLWIGTGEHGLLKRDVRTGTFLQYGKAEGLKSLIVTSVKQDAGGAIWAGTSNGLSVLQPGQRRLRTFTTEDGLVGNNIYSLSFPFPNQPDRLLVLLLDRLCWVHTDRIGREQPLLRTYLEQVQVNNQLHYSEERSFSYGQQQFQFVFSGVNLDNSEENEYAYMLEGHEKDWVYNGNWPVANYANLAPGRYTFRAKAAGSNGVWSVPATYQFVIRPPFWRTGWFYAGCAVLLAVLLYGWYRYQLSKALAMYRIRSRISRDLHDEVGSTLSSISLMNELAVRTGETEKMHRRISESLQQVQNAMSDIVWVVNPLNDAFDNLLLRLGEVSAAMLEPKGIQYALHFPKAFEPLKIPMEKRRDVFMIFKECLANIIKYANCTTVHITLECKQKQITLIISDNGRGFDFAARRSGNGLSNIAARAAALRGEVQWQTAPGQGTTMKLSFPGSA